VHQKSHQIKLTPAPGKESTIKWGTGTQTGICLVQQRDQLTHESPGKRTGSHAQQNHRIKIIAATDHLT
jgi:hypothetical protein